MREHIFDKSKTIRNNLQCKYKHSGNITFWLESKDMIDVVQSVLSMLDRYNRNCVPENFEVIKDTPVNKRLLFRMTLPSSPRKSLIIKVLNVHLLRLKYCWMKYHRYGFAETANLIIAKNRDIKVPGVYGYGRINGPLGLIQKDIVILEDLRDHISISQLLEQNRNNGKKCIEILDSVIPLLIAHYKAGCNNWDINAGSIVYNRLEPQTGPVALDFEYIVYHSKPSLDVLVFLAARLAWHILYDAKWFDEDLFNPWAVKLLEAVPVTDEVIKNKFKERFDYYYSFDYIPHKVRMSVS